MPFQIAYCDDDKTALELRSPKILRAFRKLTPSAVMLKFSGSKQLLHYILEGHALDVLFLDIDMPGLDGIELSRRLRESGNDVPVIFLSSREDRVFETFAVRPFHFLRKEHFAEEIDRVAASVYEAATAENRQTVVFSDGVRSYHLLAADIRYVDILDQTLTIHMKENDITLRYRMGDAEDALAPYGFIRVHKGYLVNYRYIFAIQREELSLDDGTVIPMSRRRYSDVKAEFLRLTADELRNGV